MQQLRLWHHAPLVVLLLLFGFQGKAQVTADFTSNTTSGCSPLVVQFSDLSTGPVTSWFWNFGNGNTSTLQNPAAVYVTPGTYTVSLTVSDGANNDTQTQTNYITVFQNPASNFTSTTASGCAPLTVCFSDISTPGDGTINQWLWDFGDGNNSTVQNPCHTFSAAGSYTITLVVTDDNGCSNTFLVNNYVNVSNTPVAAFSGGPFGACTPPLSVTFTNNSSGGSAPLSYQWDFGDGNSSTGANPTHTYTSLGSFTVTLIATDQNGCADTLVVPAYVNINSVTAAFTQDTTRTCEGQPINFTDQSTGPPNSWQWDFGDGNTSNQQNPSHAYATAGTYTVTLIASSGTCSDTVVQTNLIIVDPAPVAAFTSDTTGSCEAPLTVNFQDLSTGGAVSWAWDFGDGNTSTAQNPTHTYTATGSYTVTLTVTSGSGCTNTITIPNYINIIEPVANFDGLPVQGCVPLLVNFNDLSTSVEPIVSWQWDFGDGNTSTAQNPGHTYTATGVYTVTLIITNAAGCTDTLVRPNYIQVGDVPIACFSNNPSLVCINDPVSFTDCSINATDWFWEFGDGGTSTQQNPNYTYGDTGCFTVTLTVSNFGCTDDTVITNAVCVLPPVARFALNPAVGCAVPHTVFFTDQSILPDTWFWDFGDGNTSTAQNPIHNYVATGNYVVTLTVTDTVTGCQDQATANVSISIPVADFSGAPLFGCGPLTVNFTDASTGATGWAWDFGDGGTSNQQNPTHTYQTPGIYTVTLTVTDANGCTDTRTRTNYVQVIGPDVNFGADTLAGCIGLTVNFTDSTVFGAPITGWTWDFGDGNTSNQQNPAHTYTTAGNFDVSLTVTDVDGCSRTLTFTNYILVTDPSAAFTVNDSLTCIGSAINFNNGSSGSGLSYVWDFGDGNSSTATNPNHNYTVNGTYNVSLIVTDVNGCMDTAVNTGIVDIQDVNALFGAAPTNASCPPLLVVFTDSSNYDIVSWEWDFGDGTGSTLQNPSHVYATAGSFDVSLIVVNDDGCTDTLLVPGLVNILGPNGSFTFAPDSGCTPLDVAFNATATNTASYTWDFGDGNVAITTADSVIHTYTQTGVFNPILILDDGLGCTFSIISPDSIVVDTIPFPDFAVDTTLNCTLDSVRFTDLTVSTRPIVSWFWDFGDGNTSTDQNPVHFYNNPGSYVVTLAVVNSLGCTDTIVRPAAVGVFNPPTAAIFPLDTIGCNPFTVPFQDQSTGPQSVTGWDWDFGNGNTSTAQNPSATFATGNYTVTLIVTDSVGCVDTASTTVTATPGPTASFIADDSIGCPPHPVNFTAGTGQGIVGFNWNLGDGTVAFGTSNVFHTYQTSGNFDVTLVVTDTLGCRDTLVKPQYIQINPPVADFNANVTSGCPILAVTFTDASTFTNNIVSFDWDFGDGTTGTGNPVSHNYDSSGVFTVTLIITDNEGCMDTAVRPAYITVFEPPVSIINPLDTVGCAPFTVPFADASTGVTGITAWDWNFGNGNTGNGPTSTQSYPAAGGYTVSLIVTDGNGCRDTSNTSVTATPGPDANFVADDSIGCPPHPVTFTGNTGQGIVTWVWDFGDGTDSTTSVNTVDHTYLAAGNYTVTLIVIDTLGCEDTIVKPNYIEINPPVADFNANTTSGCPVLAVTFTDASTFTNNIVNFSWDFGDGNTGTGNPVNHSYDSSGVFTVTLIITDSEGCMDTAVRPAYITVFEPPAALINPQDSVGCAPFTVPFSDASTGVVGITAWNWNFGNGNTGNGPTSTQNYPAAGGYTVSLIVTDANGCQDTTTTSVTATPGPDANFVADDSIGCQPHPVLFTANTGQGIVTWIWDFGDGTDTTTATNAVNHTYTGTGSFTVQLIVVDTLGCEDTIVKPNYIQINPPVADFNANATSGCPAFTTTFTDASTGVNNIVAWNWDFGDATTGVGNPVTHTYPLPGTYTVTLIVTDDQGCMDTIVRPNYITVFEPPTALFGITDTIACNPFTIQLTDSSTGIVPVTGWDWDFGDGNTSVLQNPTNGYVTPGTYPITLIVTDANGCMDTTQLPFTAPVRPEANFISLDTLNCDPSLVTFVADSIDVVGWTWTFGDGGDTIGGPIVTHFYPDRGSYTITLITEDIYGCLDTLTRPNYIFIDSLRANFNIGDLVGCSPLTVNFTDLSVSDTTIVGWAWDFGDGGSSTQQNPVHVYTTPGFYDVTLVVTNAIGCTDTIQIGTIEVFDNTPPVAPPIYMVTVLDNSTDSISWQSYQNGSDFSHYVLYWAQPVGSNNYVPLDSFFNINDTTFTHLGLNTLNNSYCYRLQVVDRCGLRSDVSTSQEHCTIDLEASPGIDLVNLAWNDYVGWGQVDEYDIYRVNSYSQATAVLIGTVPGNQTTYVDTAVTCNEIYCYRVRARELGGFLQESWSDTSCAEPIHIPNELPMKICAASVVNDSVVEITWDFPPVNNPMLYFLEKSLNGNDWTQIAVLQPNIFSFTDVQVNVQEQSYYYRVAVLDSCGDLSPWSNIGRTILLTGENNNGPTLYWNPYEEWAFGVSDYEIEVFNELLGVWQFVENADGDAVTYRDVITSIDQPIFCYRITGTEENGACRSTSNIACVPVGPRLYAPNAFTPNGDGLNDFFELKGIYIATYNLRIYDRWGALIFESNDLNTHWDGFWREKPAQEGVFVWVVTATGFDQSRIDLKGTVTLYR